MDSLCTSNLTMTFFSAFYFKGSCYAKMASSLRMETKRKEFDDSDYGTVNMSSYLIYCIIC